MPLSGRMTLSPSLLCFLNYGSSTLTAVLYNCKDSLILSRAHKQRSCLTVKLLCDTTRRNENETQTVPVVLETSVDGGSQPGCYREHWHSVVGVIRMPAPWLIHENKPEKSLEEFIVYVAGSLLICLWNTPSRIQTKQLYVYSQFEAR